MLQKNINNRTIFCQDNIEILKGIDSNTIDLIYLDPPFNKQKEFTAPIGSSAEGASFSDVFREEDVKDEWVKSIKEDDDRLYQFLSNVKDLSSISNLKVNKHYLYNYCYLTYMAIRLLELKRILKQTGSIYLHCDATMSHYLKILMDIIFGEKNFRNEIVWCYHGPGSPNMKQFNRKSDNIFWYSKGDEWTFNKNDVRLPFKDPKQSLRKAMATDGTFSEEEIEAYRKKGKIPENWWEIRIAARSKKEYVGYPTQKPLKLLERIIKATSNEGDLILDPFCGCATTCIASEKLKRKWIGIDISVKAFDLVRERLKKEVANPDDLLQYDKEVFFSTTAPKRTDKNGKDNLIQKYVYVISNPAFEKMYKVGIANDIKSRLNTYQTSDPNRAYQLEHKRYTAYFRELEKHIHDKFDGNYEWVKGDLEDIIGEIENFKPEEKKKNLTLLNDKKMN